MASERVCLPSTQANIADLATERKIQGS